MLLFRKRLALISEAQAVVAATPFGIDADGRVLTAENYKYDRDVQKFINWLNEGLNHYRQ